MNKLNQLTAKLGDMKVIILDEVSMVGPSDLTTLDACLKQVCTDPTKKELPFAGVHIIFVGDFLQYPPVGKYSLYKELTIQLLKEKKNVLSTGQLVVICGNNSIQQSFLMRL